MFLATSLLLYYFRDVTDTHYCCVKRKNQLDATYFIIYSILIDCSTCFGR